MIAFSSPTYYSSNRKFRFSKQDELPKLPYRTEAREQVLPKPRGCIGTICELLTQLFAFNDSLSSPKPEGMENDSVDDIPKDG